MVVVVVGGLRLARRRWSMMMMMEGERGVTVILREGWVGKPEERSRNCTDSAMILPGFGRSRGYAQTSLKMQCIPHRRYRRYFSWKSFILTF